MRRHALDNPRQQMASPVGVVSGLWGDLRWARKLLAGSHPSRATAGSEEAWFKPSITFRSGPSKMQMTPQPRHIAWR